MAKLRTEFRVVSAFLLVALSLAALVHAESLVGTLSVRTTPGGVRIYVAGVLKGNSPCVISDVGVGQVEVTAEKEGYATERKTVEVNSDTVTGVEFKLRRLENVGNLVVQVEPEGSAVELDRVAVGKTPLRLINIPAGTHRLKVSQEGYRPLYADVLVVSDKDNPVKGKLIEGSGLLGESGPITEEDLQEPVLKPEDIPSEEQMPEAKAFEPVRKLLSERKYDEALDLLRQMAQQEETKKYAARVARDNRYVERARKLVANAYDAVRQKLGQDCQLQLKGGITIEGKILSATAEHLVVDLTGSGEGTEILLSRLSVERLIKLAGQSYSPDEPSNQELFAVLYAMEGEYSNAYEALRRAAGLGHNVADAKSYVDSEKLWHAAKQKEESEKKEAQRKAAVGEKDSQNKEGAPSVPVVVVDRFRGGPVGEDITSVLGNVGYKVTTSENQLTDEDLKSAAVILIRERGQGPAMRSYEPAELNRIMRFIAEGGGLVFFGSNAPQGSPAGPAPPAAQPPFEPLFRALEIGVIPDRLVVSQRAPKEHPRNQAPAFPSQMHPITAGIREVRFALSSSSVAAPKGAEILVTSTFVESTVTRRTPAVMAAVRALGKGRVVVFASMPSLRGGEGDDQGLRLVVNAVQWAAFPKAPLPLPVPRGATSKTAP